MKHRHIDDKTWSQAALDSLFERGDMPDWEELYGDIKDDPSLIEKVERCAKRHPELEKFAQIFLDVAKG
jgi:hypothetical protein